MISQLKTDIKEFSILTFSPDDVDAVIEDINNTLDPTVHDLNNHVSKTEETLMKILKTYQQQEDEKTKRTVLFSNIDYPDVPEGINDTMNFWPKLRMQLRCLGLEDIMTGAEKIIKLKSGSLRITYIQSYGIHHLHAER